MTEEALGKAPGVKDQREILESWLMLGGLNAEVEQAEVEQVDSGAKKSKYGEFCRIHPEGTARERISPWARIVVFHPLCEFSHGCVRRILASWQDSITKGHSAMPPEANIQFVMRQHLYSVAVLGLHSSDESSAGFDVRNSLVAVACARCLLPHPHRC